MSAISEHWDDSKCCCHFPDGRECFRSRHSVSPDNYHDHEHDGECECACHDEYYQALEDSGEYEEYYP